MSETRLLFIGIWVFALLGYHTFQIKQAVDRPSLVVHSERPVAVGDDTSNFKFNLDGKWKKPSEAGSAWLAKVWAISPAESGSKIEQFICPFPQCPNTALLTILHGTGVLHQKTGQDTLDDDDLAGMYRIVGCDKARDKDSQKFEIPPALAYRFACGDAGPMRSRKSLHVATYGDAHFMLQVRTFPSLGYDVDTALTDEATSRLTAVE